MSLSAFSQTKELVYIRIQENLSAFGVSPVESYMSIIYADQSTKWVDLVKISGNRQGAEANGKTIQKEISTLVNEGYEIQFTSVGADNYVSTTLIILIRKTEAAK